MCTVLTVEKVVRVKGALHVASMRMKRLWRVRGVALHAFEFRLCVLVCCE